MDKHTMKKILSLILCVMLVAAMALTTTGCGENQNTETEAAASGAFENGASLGEGAVKFTFTVVDLNGVETTAEISSDKETLGDALLELGIISGEVGEYGLMVDTVNGAKLDWDKDGKYWALYIDGEYAQTGVDQTAITAGATYMFKAE